MLFSYTLDTTHWGNFKYCELLSHPEAMEILPRENAALYLGFIRANETGANKLDLLNQMLYN